MKVFGCLTYHRNTATNGDKFEVRGRPGVFLGYLSGTKGYKIYDMKDKKIVISRDVRFYENKFPFDSLTHTQEETDPFDPQVQPTQCDDTHYFFDSNIQPSPNDNQHNYDENLGPEIVSEDSSHDTSSSVLDEMSNMNNTANEGLLDPSEQLGRPKRQKSQPKRLDDFVV